MSRTTRNNMKDSSFFHIITQGINKEKIFDTDENKERYLKLIYRNNEGIDIIAYCIMSNHAHILVKIDSIDNMQQWMKKVNTGYAMYYNKRNDRVGYVFRDRYKSQVIRNEKHLYTCIDYIHENPVKAHICGKKEEYDFSSYISKYKGNQNEVKMQIAQMFNNIEENSKKEKFEFIESEEESKEENCQNIINDFLNEKGIYVEQLIKREKILIELIKILKFQNNISYRIMEKILGISREKLRLLSKR